MKKILILVAIFGFGLLFGADNAKIQAKAIYNKWCLPCHGDNMPATKALAILYKDSDIPANLEKRTDLTPEMVEFFVRNGKHSMPFFRKTEINDDELRKLGEYLSTPRK